VSDRIGLPLRMIASEYSESEVCSTTQTVMRALPVLHELSRATRSEVRLDILRGSDVVILQPRTNRFSERVHAEGLLHGVVPEHAAASGKALLAVSPPAVIDHVIASGLLAFTPHTITSPEVLRRKLSVIRLTQIATSRNELECGKAAIAMPIFYGGGRVAAAIELAVRDTPSTIFGTLTPRARSRLVSARRWSVTESNTPKSASSCRPTHTSLVTTIAKRRSRPPRFSSATGGTEPKKAPSTTMRLSIHKYVHKGHENGPRRVLRGPFFLVAGTGFEPATSGL
jgi:DNA-binding IclR family transcriptional regulator